MTNLLEETVGDIVQAGHTVADVAWVGSAGGEYAVLWNEFADAADAVNYDSGYGGNEIPGDLVVVFNDGSWLERGEYDGSEWWEFKRTPVRGEAVRFGFLMKEHDILGRGKWISRDFEYVAV